eukprot:211881-Chlamydomonas_euryale.AAC.1
MARSRFLTATTRCCTCRCTWRTSERWEVWGCGERVAHTARRSRCLAATTRCCTCRCTWRTSERWEVWRFSL